VSHFPHDDVAAFSNSYEFLMAVRCELHMLCRNESTPWKATFSPALPLQWDSGENGAGALMESFFKTVRTVKYFAMLFLESGIRRTAFGIAPVEHERHKSDSRRGGAGRHSFLQRKNLPPLPPEALWV